MLLSVALAGCGGETAMTGNPTDTDGPTATSEPPGTSESSIPDTTGTTANVPTTGPDATTGDTSSSSGTDAATSLDPDPCVDIDCPRGTECVEGACQPIEDIPCPSGATLAVLPAFGRDSSAVMFVDDIAYLATAVGIETYAIDAVEAAKTEFPTPLGWLPLPGSALALAANGPVLAVAHGHHGATLVDVSDPAAPIALGHVDAADAVSGVSLVDGLLAVAAGADGLVLHDVVDPAEPLPLGVLPTATPARDVFLLGDLAYVAAELGGLLVIDVGDPSDPQLVTTLDTGGEAVRLRRAGDRLYVAARSGGVRIFDITAPAAPQALGAYTLGNNLIAADVAIDASAELAHVADYWVPLRILDVSDPGAPVALGTVDTPDGARGLAVHDATVWLATGGGTAELSICDVTDPAKPELVSSLGEANKLRTRAIRESGDLVYLAGDAAGLVVVDPDAQGGPTRLASRPATHPAIAVDVAGERAYVGLDRTKPVVLLGALQVFDVADPADPTLLGTLDFDGVPHSLRVHGDVVYVGSGGVDGLLVIDVADPQAPSLIKTFPGTHSFLDIEGNLLAADNGDGMGQYRMELFDITDPNSPVLVGEVETPPGLVRAVALDSTTAFLTIAGVVHDMVAIVDVVDPTNPALLATLELPFQFAQSTLDAAAGTLWTVGQTAPGKAVVQAYDLTDPQNPVPSLTLPIPGKAPRALHAGARIFAGDSDVPLSILTPTCE